MSRLTGGIFSNPSGKTGGVVFGAARTRTGKVVTSRLLVPPSNPNTAGQQQQRSKFLEALGIVRLIGASDYQDLWNRAIGQLPGFQSLLSVYLNAMDSVASVGVIPPINLGSLHSPNTFSAAAGAGSKQITCTWSTELGVNGDADDGIRIYFVEKAKAASPLERNVVLDQAGTRQDGSVTVDVGLASTVYSILMFARGEILVGVNSATKNTEATSSAA